jgi:hypothetical protein
MKFSRMIKSALVMFMCTLLLWQFVNSRNHACAQDTLLFISTSPINATVLLDGSPQLNRSPLLIRTLGPGDHTIEIMGLQNPGSPCKITLSRGEIRSLSFDYVNNHILMHTVHPPSFVTEIPLLPEEYPKQKSIKILNIAIPVFVVISGLLTINDAVYSKDTGLFFSPITITAYTVTAGLAGYRIALGRQKKRYIQSVDEQFEHVNTPYRMALEQYNRGQEALSLDELDQALFHYTTIVHQYQNTMYMPYALYKIAKIQAIQEQYELATKGFSLITAQYPLSDLYDRSLKSLADIAAAQGRYVESIGYLDRMVYADPLFNRNAVNRYKAKLEEQWMKQRTYGEGESE